MFWIINTLTLSFLGVKENPGSVLSCWAKTVRRTLRNPKGTEMALPVIWFYMVTPELSPFPGHPVGFRRFGSDQTLVVPCGDSAPSFRNLEGNCKFVLQSKELH